MAPKSQLMGYNQDLFNMGQQLGQQPDDHPIWEQPFQSPYGGGGDPSFGGGGGGILQGGADYPIGPNSWDQMQPQQQMMAPPPSPKQDLNHPFWGQVGQYLGSDSFKDSLLAGVIAGQMATNPQAALQLAVQFKEQRERRKWQAQQNEMQRQATQENIKARAEIVKQNKEQATFEKRAAKIQAGMQGGNVPPEAAQQWIAENGPLGPENIDKAEADWAIMQSQIKAQERAQKEGEKKLTQQRQVLGDIAKGLTMGKTPWDNEPDFKDARAAAEAAGKQRTDFVKARNQNRLELDGLNAKLKRLDAQQKTVEGGGKSLKFKQATNELNEAFKHVTDVENDIDSFHKASKTPFGNLDYTKELSDKQDELVVAQQRYQKAVDNARSLAGGKDIDLQAEAPDAKPKGLTPEDLQRLIDKRAATGGQ